jgi:hypothetical protein
LWAQQALNLGPLIKRLVFQRTFNGDSDKAVVRSALNGQKVFRLSEWPTPRRNGFICGFAWYENPEAYLRDTLAKIAEGHPLDLGLFIVRRAAG